MGEDLRLQKTYDNLFAAFLVLLEKTTFEKMTVKELCKEAKTRTATFYSHFSDKYDFFVFMMKRIGRNYMGMIQPTFKEDPKQFLDHFIQRSFDFLEDNQEILSDIFKDNTLSSFIPTFSKEASEEIEQCFRLLLKDPSSIKPAIMAQMFIGSMATTSQWWFSRREKISKEEITKIVTDIFRIKETLVRS